MRDTPPLRFKAGCSKIMCVTGFGIKLWWQIFDCVVIPRWCRNGKLKLCRPYAWQLNLWNNTNTDISKYPSVSNLLKLIGSHVNISLSLNSALSHSDQLSIYGLAINHKYLWFCRQEESITISICSVVTRKHTNTYSRFLELLWKLRSTALTPIDKHVQYPRWRSPK